MFCGSMVMDVEKFLDDEAIRAEDVLLGTLGFDLGSRITSLKLTESGYQGHACWQEGDEFSFESQGPLSDLELWAVQVLSARL